MSCYFHLGLSLVHVVWCQNVVGVGCVVAFNFAKKCWSVLPSSFVDGCCVVALVAFAFAFLCVVHFAC